MVKHRFSGRRHLLSVVAVVALAMASLAAAPNGGAGAAPAAAPGEAGLYIVQTAGDPAGAYDGGVAGFAPTKPGKGKKLNPDRQAVKDYRQHLRSQHNQTLARAGLTTSDKVSDLSVAFNGYTARLTDAEATRLAHTQGVVNVWKNEIVEADTISTPTFLGLTGSGGTWAKEFGGPAKAGEGVIVGVIDSGFWPESASFAPLPEPRPDAADIAAQWHGECVAGDEEPVTCNNKVLGARWYNEGGLALPAEFLSPRDRNSHGSHTASTAAGNNNVPAVINGVTVGNVSGMAPAARIAVYKALWNLPDGTASGATVDLVQAIDDAVADGVDVINYSISGSRTFVVDPVELAFLFAAEANVFVATSAGNNGPAASTVAHNSPWLTTVAASTHDRLATKTVTLGNGSTYSGLGVGPAVASAPLIDSTTAGLAGANATQVRQCFSGTLDPAKVTGKIVLCERGVNARTDKSLAVKQAGGVGMILWNPTANSLNADFHFVPSIHVDQVAGAAIKAYAATAGATASISAGVSASARAPAMGAFSSRGPALAGGGDLLKPDITAPGVDVIAAVSPPGDAGGNQYNALSGTSMSSPHIAGIAALLRGKHPGWSPIWIKSALMTNATPLDNTDAPIQDAGHDATPLDYGSGHVRPGMAFNPGLVYDSDSTDWLQYGCGIGQIQLITPASFCTDVGSIDPSDLNYPTISVGDLAGQQTVKRTFTNIDGKASQYNATVQAPPGFTATVSDSKITVPPLQSRSYNLTLTRTTAALNAWAFGSITWTDKRGHVVRSAIAVRPVALAAPAEVAISGTSGSRALTIRPGYTGTLNTAVAGLVPAEVSLNNLQPGGTFNPGAPASSPQTAKVTVTVPAGSTVARFATYDADYTAGTDIDLFVYQAGTSTLVGQSAGGTSEESVTLTAAGTYDVYANLFAAPVASTEVSLNKFVVPSTAAGNLTATPASQAVTTGVPTTVNLTWSGLATGTRYLGALLYTDGSSNSIGRTLVALN